MIEIKNLSFRYKKKEVFKGLTLNLQAGCIYGLLGKNGTGKSTLLRNICGLLFPQEGSIKVLNFTPMQRKPSFLQDIFLIPEEFTLPNVKIDQFIQTNACFYPNFSKAAFDNYINEFDIPIDNTLQSMSYGQMKKVLISFGLACNTKILLMDEPTNGLDIVSKSQFRKVIAGVISDEKCIVISTHQVKDLENLIDRITIIDEGKILFDEHVNRIADVLTFQLSFDEVETKNAIYAEESLKGNLLVTANYTATESKIDLELLYRAILFKQKAITQLFNN